ncbi:MAG: hypothetical protein WBA23_06285 [Tunicatimonas sp.]|uniref:hypothetical protein n=1 Tax=Tunicatimonas sp. TaxID=1940096 RepID=UPI003C78278D
MKNEDKIVELLSESLKRLDQHSELLQKVVDRQENSEKRIVASVNALADIVQAWMEKTKKTDDFEVRLRKLEKHTGL